MNENITSKSNKSPSSENSHSNLETSELDDNTNEKLKGDLIGDTAYSQTFALKTLLLFDNPDFEFSEAIEEDLCSLWDMTIEEDVCKFLHSLNFEPLACENILINNSGENRLMEIIIGMLGNCLIPQSVPDLNLDHKKIVLSFIDSDDTLILVQLMRFIKTLVFKAENVSFIDENLTEKIFFILNNSLDSNLIENTLNVVAKITEDEKLDIKLIDGHFVDHCWSALSTLIDRESNEMQNLQIYKSDLIRRNVISFVQIMVNLGVYCNNHEYSNENTSTIIGQIKEYENIIVKTILLLLDSLRDDLNFASSEFTFLLESLEYLMDLFAFNCDQIFKQLFSYCEDVEDEVLRDFIPIFQLCFEKSNIDYFKREFSGNLNVSYRNLSKMCEIKKDLRSIDKVNELFAFLNDKISVNGTS